MKVNRFKSSEISVGRLLEAAIRRLVDLPHMMAWRNGAGVAEENRKALRIFRDKHLGERCIIMANGPSLAKIDPSMLRGETTFGLNRIYLMANVWDFLPTYYVCINELILDQFHHEITRLTMPKFVNWNSRRYFTPEKRNTFFLRTRLNLKDAFWTNIENPISSGGTVTYAALQIAYYMGFDQVVIVGLDHHYREKGTPNRAVVRGAEKDVDHFHPEYFPKGSVWQPPDLLRSELAYGLAREAYEKSGRQIIDATLGGKCEIFEKMELESIFDGVGKDGL